MNSTILVPRPVEIPKNLTRLSQSYMLKASLAVLAIIVFFALYAALIIGLGYLVQWAFTYDMIDVNKLTIIGKLGAIAGSIMLFAFTLKFIFKLKNHKPINRIQLNKNDHPELFAFIHEICKETGAPKPKSIYVDPDVNAYVSYTNVWLSLFLPTGKDLTIGLGLVSALNLSEFKAVMAHEFGHFAQKSMKIGSYIHSANTIIFDMIFNRDKWDQLLDRWRNSDIRLSIAAWVITPIIWLIRKTLELFYMFLNYMHSALSREMEFNADKVAVQTTGSLAIVSALWKLDFGSNYWNTIVNTAHHATKKNVFTVNLYTHNLNFVEKDKPNVVDKFNALTIDETGSKQFFSSSNNSSVSMYASHPPNDHREKNAKTPYVACDFDERSPWILFRNPEQLQEKMTQLVYENYLGKKANQFVEVHDFEKFIDAENRNTALLSELENTFENRFITIPDLDKLKYLEPYSGDFESKYIDLKNRIKELMIPVKALEQKMLTVYQISAGEIKDKTFEYKGEVFTKKTLQDCYTKIIQDRDDLLNSNFTEWDEDFIKSFYRLAMSKGKDQIALKYYNQQLRIGDLFREMISFFTEIISDINTLQSKQEVEQVTLIRYENEIKNKVQRLNAFIDKLVPSEFIPLSNIDSCEELKDALIEGGAFERETGPIFEDGGLDRIFIALDNAIANCGRIENKNIDSMLAFHQSIMEK